jgi:hypothetical protein
LTYDGVKEGPKTMNSQPQAPLPQNRSLPLRRWELASLHSDDMDFSGMRVNLSELTNELSFHLQRTAMRRFNGNPRRFIRLARNHPNPWRLPTCLPIFLHRATKGMLPAQGARKGAAETDAPNDCPPGT